jgi:hypothetical protein
MIVSVISLAQFMAFIDEVKLLKGVKTAEILGGFIPRELALLLPAISQLPNLSLIIVFEAPEVLKYLNFISIDNIRVETSVDILGVCGSTNFLSNVSTLYSMGMYRVRITHTYYSILFF